jgi:hypothetical protein
MEVLYLSSIWVLPPSLIPLRACRDTHPSTAQGDRREHTNRTPLISMAATGGAFVPYGHHDSLVEAPSLMGVPSSDPSGRILPAKPNPPVVGLGIDVSGEAEPPPACFRFESRSRLPVASDLFGPYPHISALNPPAR